jgi:hypothetical protein
MIGPWTIYGLKWQTIAFTADAENCTYTFNGQTTSPIAFDADAATYQAFIATVEDALDRAAASAPNLGRPPIHRLNRLEYTNAIRDLFNLEIDGKSMLPADDSGYGFDNIADVLSVSPGLLERYLLAANKTKHGKILCVTCHQAKHKTVPKCQDCHGSPHPAGMMSKFTNCKECHNPKSGVRNDCIGCHDYHHSPQRLGPSGLEGGISQEREREPDGVRHEDVDDDRPDHRAGEQDGPRGARPRRQHHERARYLHRAREVAEPLTQTDQLEDAVPLAPTAAELRRADHHESEDDGETRQPRRVDVDRAASFLDEKLQLMDGFHRRAS